MSMALYFPATPAKALLSVTSRNHVYFVAFNDRSHALKTAQLLNAKQPIFLKGELVRCSCDHDLVVHEADIEDLRQKVASFGIHVCSFEEQGVLALERTCLGPGHDAAWSCNDQRVICEDSYLID